MKKMTRRSVMIGLTGVFAFITSTHRVQAGAPSSARTALYSARRGNWRLTPSAMRALPLGSIKPAGWLRRQLEIQASGLGGRLDETWSDVGPNSGWLGGTGESWERGPYFLDGLLPLAWLLESTPLKSKAQKFIDWTLNNRWPNGMIGPRTNDDWWPRMVMLKVLTQYFELTADPRVIPAMTDYFVYQLAELPKRPLKDWGRFRWQDEVVSILWLYERTKDYRLIELANLLRQQGFDWQAMFANFQFKEKVTPESIGLSELRSGDHQNGLKDLPLSVHGVNNAQAIKVSPLWSRVSGKQEDLEAVHHHLAELDNYHGLPNGMFSADEHLAGRSPSQGVELCAIVETLYSLELVLAITGDASVGDRIERIAYNALPASFTDDMWAHQYDQQPNQVECSLHRRPWTTNGPESNLFGLEPHFGCCTANFHQGWPKLCASLWMASADDGLAAALYAPCVVETTVRKVGVRIEQKTDYPFRDHIAIGIHPERPVTFPLRLRVPGWAQTASIRVNGESVKVSAPGTFTIISRRWQRGDVVELQFKSEVRFVRGYNNSVSVQQGALVFALPIGEAWVKLRSRGLTADWQVYPTSPWNYGLKIEGPVVRTELPVGDCPFAGRNAPVSLTIAGTLVPGWKAEEGAADPVPSGPIELTASQVPEQLTLRPYAGAKLRITAFPVIDA